MSDSRLDFAGSPRDASDAMSERGYRALLILLLSFSTFVICCAMTSNSLHGVDEARYGIISKDMLASGDWVTPRMGTEPYFRKPPLRFWVQAPLFYFFGYSEWVVRFWSAAAAAGCIFFTVLMGRMLFGSQTGLWAGFALTTCVQFLYVHCATTGEMDALLLFLITSSLYCFLKSEEKPSYLPVSAALMGLASLTKNLGGFVPLGIAILYLIVSGKWKIYRKQKIGFSILLLFMISFSWILAMAVIHQENFLQNYFLRQIYQRAVSDEFVSGMDNARVWHRGLLFIVKTMFSGFFPWSLLVIPAVIQAVFRFHEWRMGKQLMPLLWFFVYLTGLVFFKNKFHWYIIPLYPPLCILVGNYLVTSLSGCTIGPKPLLTTILLVCGMLIFLPSFHFNPFQFLEAESELRTLIVSPYLRIALLIAAGLSLLWLILLKQSTRTAKRIVPILLISYSVVFACLPLQYSQNKSEVHLLARDIKNEATMPRNTLFLWNIPIITFKNAKETTWSSAIIARWYFFSIPRTRVYFLSPNEKELKNLLNEGGNKIFLIPEGEYDKMKSRIPHRFITARTVNQRKYVVIRPN
jgi:Dolichyl-phosphate-mannose-protein mannosyltransferase